MSEVFSPMIAQHVGPARPDPRTEIDRARTRGYADGFASGRRDAKEAAESERATQAAAFQAERDAVLRSMREAVSAVHEAAAALSRRTAELTAAGTERVEALAVELAETILSAEVSDEARSAAHALRRAVEIGSGLTARVLLAPEDEERVRECADAHEGLVFEASSRVDRGGVIVHADDTTIDGRLAEALARARSALAEGASA
ncbi:FliH/SctL family protein [Microbacterium suaedae]|uniref:FliH/SctL family protein n=1 Tax=Microbacterium suaedae TaxID=2067813 RepID=UPI0013A634AB|nr:FliH/SctL family protein [Microbacterium suaedae]